jgi:hypothetical protein
MSILELPYLNATPRFSDKGEGLQNRLAVEEFVADFKRLQNGLKIEANKNHIPSYMPNPIGKLPFCLQLKYEEDKRIALNKKKIKNKLNKSKNAKDVFELIKILGLTYKQLNNHPPHNRAINPNTRNYVDWWKSGTIKKVNGEYEKHKNNNEILFNELRILSEQS